MATSLTLAIMDRNPHVRELICRELAALGHRALPVRSGAEALGLLAEPEPPQVLVADPEAAEGRLADIAAGVRRSGGRVVMVLHVFAGGPDRVELQAESAPGALVVEKQAHLGPLMALVASLSRGAVPGVAAPDGNGSGNAGARGAGV